ncbi:MAG: biotin--[acetyl-CoA-carboxylase] ligase [Acidobacteriota bacterium]
MIKLGEKTFIFEKCTSSNRLSKIWAEKGYPEGTCIVCLEQTEGRGRLDRKWHSPKEKGLYLSLILRPLLECRDITILSLLTAMSCADFLNEKYGFSVKVKWPNDLILFDKKLGGILLESSTKNDMVEYVVLGIGINLKNRLEDFPEDIKDKSISIKIGYSTEPDFDEIRTGLVGYLSKWLSYFFQNKKNLILEKLSFYSYLKKDDKIEIRTGEKILYGIFMGYGETGYLKIKVDDGLEEIYEGELVKIEK